MWGTTERNVRTHIGEFLDNGRLSVQPTAAHPMRTPASHASREFR